MPTTETQESRALPAVMPFGIEADHPRNSNLLMQCVPGCILRSAVDGRKGIKDAKTGDEMIPHDQVRHMGSFPPTPGMQIHVNPATLSYIILDPLTTNEDLCERVRKWVNRNTPFRVENKITGVDTIEGKLDEHRMKSLVREMVWLVESGEAKVAKGGAIPTMDDVEEMEGKFLLNPGSRVQNTQPMFEKDFPQWLTDLTRSGG